MFIDVDSNESKEFKKKPTEKKNAVNCQQFKKINLQKFVDRILIKMTIESILDRLNNYYIHKILELNHGGHIIAFKA